MRPPFVTFVLCLELVGCLSSPSASTAEADPLGGAGPEAPDPVVAKGAPARPLPGKPRKPPALRLPSAARIVAIGDLHGDLAATRASLRLAGLIDASDHWSGGKTVAVQVGDQLDRGDDEREILHLLERLSGEAEAQGGGFYALLGNHELMNVALDLRYVTPAGFADFRDIPLDDPQAQSIHSTHRGRVAAFMPGGPYARLLSGHNVALIVGSTLFAHGGVLEAHVRYGLARLNAEVSAWMRGDGTRPPVAATDSEGVAWTRRLSLDTTAADCDELGRVLSSLGVARLVVAHTVQPEGINSACDERVWRVDVGLSSHYGGEAAVLEIAGERVTPLPPAR